MPPRRQLFQTGLSSLLLGMCSIALRAEDVVAVLSSQSSYYQEAHEGFTAAFGSRVPSLTAPNDASPLLNGAKVIVTFGAKAALGRYPPEALVVYCLAPGTLLSAKDRSRPPIRVEMLPREGFVLTKLKELQPGLKRLAVFWSSPAMENYVKKMQSASSAFGIETLVQRVPNGEEVPDRLRDLDKKKPDALWIPPDPVLINPQTFTVFKEYSRANHVPFYVPTDGLVEKGAAASVSCDLREVGRTAALTAQKFLSNDSTAGSPYVFPEKIRVTVGVSAAEAAGLKFPPDVLRKADRVLP